MKKKTMEADKKREEKTYQLHGWQQEFDSQWSSSQIKNIRKQELKFLL